MNLFRTLALVAAITAVCRPALAGEPVIVTVAKADEKYVRHSEGTAVELKDGRLLLAWIEFTKGVGDSDFFPARIVAPGRRGFWWVKWISEIAVSSVPWWWQPPFPLQ